jgi:hypothetical protein
MFLCLDWSRRGRGRVCDSFTLGQVPVDHSFASFPLNLVSPRLFRYLGLFSSPSFVMESGDIMCGVRYLVCGCLGGERCDIVRFSFSLFRLIQPQQSARLRPQVKHNGGYEYCYVDIKIKEVPARAICIGIFPHPILYLDLERKG